MNFLETVFSRDIVIRAYHEKIYTRKCCHGLDKRFHRLYTIYKDNVDDFSLKYVNFPHWIPHPFHKSISAGEPKNFSKIQTFMKMYDLRNLEKNEDRVFFETTMAKRQKMISHYESKIVELKNFPEDSLFEFSTTNDIEYLNRLRQKINDQNI